MLVWKDGNMAIFKIDTDVVNNVSNSISGLKGDAESISNSVNGYDTSAVDEFYDISSAAAKAKNAIYNKISQLSDKIEKTATHLTDVVNKHSEVQNACKSDEFVDVDYGGVTNNKALNSSNTNYRSTSAVGGGVGSAAYGASTGLSSSSTYGGSSMASQQLTEEALERFKNGDITVDAAVKSAIDWALKTANDNLHGYSQNTRWGNPNYDCASFVISAYEAAGIPVIEAGAMRAAFLKCGFEWIPGDPDVNSLQPGDILLDESDHTEMYIGNGQNVGAHSNYDGVNGDSSGREVCVGNYYSHPWDGVLRQKK
jgi:hypothetical protein